MEYTEPETFLLAYTAVDHQGMEDFLEHIGANEKGKWKTDAPSGGDYLIEVGGRSCYQSWFPGYNKNVKRVRKGNRLYIGNILKSRHGSVLEHANVTYAFVDVSRVVTHELVRHRAGTAFSQESLRFVLLEELRAFMPGAFNEESIGELYDALAKAGKMPSDGRSKEVWVQETVAYLEDTFHGTFTQLEGVQQRLANNLYLDDLPGDFHIKKQITSAMRRMAPIGLATTIVVTGNLRAWRHQIEVRTARGAEEEIRLVFGKVARQLRDRYPNVFQDMHEEDDGSFTFENSKV